MTATVPWLYSAVDALASVMFTATGHAQIDVAEWGCCQRDAAQWMDEVLPVIRAGLAAELVNASTQVMHDAATLDHPLIRGIAVGLRQAASMVAGETENDEPAASQ